MDLQHATPELFTALAKAQAEVENADKNSSNPHFKSKYADLAEVLNTVRPVFAKHGLSILQAPSFDGALCHVTTTIAHSGGGHVTSIASCVPAKTDGQGIGAATTYLRRYSLSAMAGVAQEDDDGNAAAHSGKPAKRGTVAHPTSGVMESLTDEQRSEAHKQATVILEYMEGDDVTGACEYIDGLGLDADRKTALWSLLPSQTRTAIKKAKQP